MVQFSAPSAATFDMIRFMIEMSFTVLPIFSRIPYRLISCLPDMLKNVRIRLHCVELANEIDLITTHYGSPNPELNLSHYVFLEQRCQISFVCMPRLGIIDYV